MMPFTDELPQQDGYWWWLQPGSERWNGGLSQIGEHDGGWLCDDGRRRTFLGDGPLLTEGGPRVLWSGPFCPEETGPEEAK